jgi:post-segregation antitoxin (ccd killing protein)
MAVRQVDRALNAWAGELRRTSPAEWDAGEQEALAELARFESTWSVVREGLGLGEERP